MYLHKQNKFRNVTLCSHKFLSSMFSQSHGSIYSDCSVCQAHSSINRDASKLKSKTVDTQEDGWKMKDDKTSDVNQDFTVMQ